MYVLTKATLKRSAYGQECQSTPHFPYGSMQIYPGSPNVIYLVGFGPLYDFELTIKDTNTMK